MTDDLEAQLRVVLRERAAASAAIGDPVALVESRMKLRARRRGLAAAAAAALCVAGIAIAASALSHSTTTPLPAGPAGLSSTPTPSPSPSGVPSAVSLASGSPATSVAAASSPAAISAASVIPTPTLPPNVSSVSLPNQYTFSGLSTESGQLLLTGAITSTSQNAPCVRTPLDPAALTLGAVTTGSCDDPASAGDRVFFVVNNPDGGSTAFTSSIAITVTDPNTGARTTGPIVMRFSEASDTRPVAAYGGDSLWVYDVATSDGPEVLQVSATSGRLEDVVRTPQLYRPVLAANSDGLWLGNSIEGSPVAGTVFHVAPGSHLVTTVVPSPNDAVDWMVADRGHLWAGIRPAGGSLLSLWRFDGPKATVAFRVPEPSLEAGPNVVVGDEQNGVWVTTPDPPFGDTPAPTDNQHLDVVRLNADTGRPTVEAVLPPLDQLAAESQTAVGQAAFFAGSYFRLQSPSVGGYTGFTQLLRVTPSP
jgi:hypothetical protein